MYQLLAFQFPHFNINKPIAVQAIVLIYVFGYFAESLIPITDFLQIFYVFVELLKPKNKVKVFGFRRDGAANFGFYLFYF